MSYYLSALIMPSNTICLELYAFSKYANCFDDLTLVQASLICRHVYNVYDVVSTLLNI